jgi:NitT/TauT family transport system substrate-binding protein
MTAFSRRTFVAGCGGTALLAAMSARGGAATAIHAGVSSDDGYEAWFAQDIGLFAKAGLDVNSQLFPNGSAAAAALVGHSLDFACGNVVTVAQARDHGVSVTLVAPSILYQASAANNGLVVTSDSPIRSAKDLTGKAVAVLSVQGILALSVKVWLDQNGGDSKRVQLIEVTPPEMLAAIQRGTVAAALMVDPFLTVAGPQIRLLASPSDSIGTRLVSTGWFSTTDWIAQNQPAAKAYADVMASTARWANDVSNRAQATAIVTKYLGRSVDLGKTFYAANFDAAPMQPILDDAYRYKFISRPMTVSELVWHHS